LLLVVEVQHLELTIMQVVAVQVALEHHQEHRAAAVPQNPL
jgi:hypothetical protein